MTWIQKHLPHLHRTFRGPRRQRGVALLLATFALAMILFVAMEVQYETQIEYVVNNGAVARLKAYYAARSGLELSLLRIKMYQKLKSQFAGQAGQPGIPTAMLDMIWSFPLAWPPVLPVETNAVDQGHIDSLVKSAKMDASYQTVITDEGTKIDINDLASTSKAIRDSTKKMILQIFANETLNNTAWSQRHPNFLAEDLVNSIIDWIDADNQVAGRGGDERALYADRSSEQKIPPNRQFRTLEEVRLVHGMTDDIFDLLSPHLTVYGAKAINPNTAPPEVIQGLHSSITNEVLAEVLKRRESLTGPGRFRDAADFWTFLDQKGGRVPREIQDATPISVDPSMNFRIKSVGSYANAVSEIEVVTYDLPGTVDIVSKAMAKEKQTSTGNPNPGNPAGQNPGNPGAPQGQTGLKKPDVAKGPPRIIFWKER